jgi:hypothetical protein
MGLLPHKWKFQWENSFIKSINPKWKYPQLICCYGSRGAFSFMVYVLNMVMFQSQLRCLVLMPGAREANGVCARSL